MRTTLQKKKLVLEMQRVQQIGNVVLRVPVKTISMMSGGIMMLSVGGTVFAQNPLPVQCGGSCGGANVGNVNVVTSGNQMTIHQLDQKAILNWKSFDVAKDNKVIFDQPGKTSVALNKIYDQKASDIEGQITANGQVYLVNPNGFVFHAGSVVSTNSLVASALNIDEKLFTQAGIAKANDPTVTNTSTQLQNLGSAALGTPNDPVKKGAMVKVEAGAKIQVGESGTALLAAPHVDNEGEIRTGQSGQVILAGAQDKIYLAPGDANLRGFLVEVQTGGDVNNGGKIFADQGNVTLVGAVVNQKGIVRATSSVNLNGSIILKAQDQADVVPETAGGVNAFHARRSGSLTLDNNSKTEVIHASAAKDDYSLDELETFLNQKAADATVTASQQIDVSLAGKSIDIKSGSNITATGGTIKIKATKDPTPQSIGNNNDSRLIRDPNTYVNIESGSSIDVSGSSTTLAMSRNMVEVQLFSNELKDSPLQKNGPLKGKKVTVDVRTGTAFADVQAAVANVPKSLDERHAKGGSIIILSEGDVVSQQNSSMNVSGGKITFEGGIINTTKLLQGKKLVDISDAKPDQIYDGIAGLQTLTSKKWGTTQTWGNSISSGLGHYEAGYIQGQDAGTLSVTGHYIALDGQLLGGADNGVNQRDPSSRALGGLLEIGLIETGTRETGYENFYGTPSITLMSGTEKQREIQQSLDKQSLTLNAKQLSDSGFTRLHLNSDSTVTVAQELDTDASIDNPATVKNAQASAIQLAQGGELIVNAPTIEVDRSIAGEAATIKLKNVTTNLRGAEGKTESLVVQDHVSLNVSGGWVNDLPSLSDNPKEVPISAKYINAGTISFSALDKLTLGDAVELHADGGAYLSNKGKLKYGKGGSISLATKTSDVGLTSSEFGALNIAGALNMSAFGGYY